MKDILVVYPKDNKSIVKKLVSRIESDGMSCWVAPRDFRQDEKESVLKVLLDSKMVLLVIDKSSAASNEMQQAMQLALENQVNIIPFVIEKVEQTLYTQYFFHQMSWIDAYHDSFDEAYELLLEAYSDISGNKRDTNRKVKQKKEDQLKLKPIHYAIGIIVIMIIGYFIYTNIIKEDKIDPIVGQWKLADYKDNLPRNYQDSLNLMQGLLNLKQNSKLLFNEDKSFERIGFTPKPQKGKWDINRERTILYLEPTNEKKKDIVNIEKLNENELVFFVTEKVANEKNDTIEVTTRLFFSKVQ